MIAVNYSSYVLLGMVCTYYLDRNRRHEDLNGKNSRKTFPWIAHSRYSIILFTKWIQKIALCLFEGEKNICRYITFCVLSEEIKIFKVHFKTYLIQMKEAGAQNGELEKNLQNYLNHSRPENSKKSRQKKTRAIK